MPETVKRRPYDNSRREAAARQTRRTIVESAHRLFVDLGYPATTYAAVAAAAGVSVQTVFSHFAAKRDLLKAVVDQAIVGDDEEVPVSERPEVAAIRAEPDPRKKLQLHAALATGILERTMPVDQVVRGAAVVDLEAAELWRRGAENRRAAMTEFAAHLAGGGHLRTGITVPQAADRMAVLIDPELYRLTVDVRGWSPRQHREWLAEMLIASLLAPAD